MESKKVRRSLIGQNSSFAVVVSHYPPFLTQPPHEHRADQISFLLAGSLHETADGRTLQIGSSHLCRKPKGTVHSNKFGSHGALILSIHFACRQTADLALAGGEWQWTAMSDAQRSALIACTAEAKDFQCDEALWDVLAGGEAEGNTNPPVWLRWAKASIERAPADYSIASIASMAGVHRVHLSREFSRYFGTSPCLFRKRQMSAHALSLMVQEGVPAAIAAAEAGFADQSHMTRAIKRVAGLTPGRISGLLS